MAEDLGKLLEALAHRRQQRDEQTLRGESPHPKGADSALTRQVIGVVTQYIITPALSRTHSAINAVTNPDQKRRALHVKKWVNDAYNTYVLNERDVYGHWSHAEFEQEILNSFVTGFAYFAQVASINDVDRLRKKPKTVTRISGGKRIQARLRDERTPVSIIQDTYKDRDDDPIETYAIETASVFSVFFFHLLKNGLARRTSRVDLLEMLKRTYGISEKLFEYESDPAFPFNLDHKTVTFICRQFPAQAMKRLDAYRRLGPKLISQYWGDPTPGAQMTAVSSWVASPAMIRNLIFRHPDHVERGLAIVDERLDNIFNGHQKKIPKDVIIEVCVEFGEAYEVELQRIDKSVMHALGLYACTERTCDKSAAEGGERLFQYLQLEPKLYQLIARRRADYVKVLSDAETAYSDALDAAREKGFQPDYRSKRRIMQLLISGKTARIERILDRERARVEREARVNKRYVEKAKAYDPIWGVSYAIWGSGEDANAQLKNGEFLVKDILRFYYGDNYTEAFLEYQTDVLIHYLEAGFKPDTPELERLKECLLISPTSVRKYYESLSETGEKLLWPEGVNEFPYDDSWQNDMNVSNDERE